MLSNYLAMRTFSGPMYVIRTILCRSWWPRVSGFCSKGPRPLCWTATTVPILVTSSHPTAGGACIGAGIGPHMMQNIYGVVKAYSTRVGQGPFPTELLNETGEHIRSTAHEYGTVTGRPRRVGWLDTRAVRYAAALNSFDYLAVTRLDVLDDMDEIQVCTGYEYEGKPLEEYPADLNLLEKVTPVYRTFPGWKTAISDIRSYSELPEKARNYLEAVSELIGVPVGIVSVGPSREQTIVVKDVF